MARMAKSRPLPEAPTIDWSQPFEFTPNEAPVQPQEELPDRTWGRAAADTGVRMARGVVSGGKMLSDAFGADNAVSQGLGDAADGLGGMLSPQAQAQAQRRADLIRQAEQSGSTWEEIKAYGGSFTDDPIGMTAEAFGTMVPTLATTLIPGAGQVAGPVAMAARVGAGMGLGAAQGAGAVKGSIYQTTMRELIAQGVPPEEAAQRAAERQSYAESSGHIVAAAGLGALAGSTGMERAVSALMHGGAGSARMAGRVGMGAVAEAIPEAAQGAQEQFATNQSLTKEGMPTDPMQGVAGSAVLEGMAGGTMGAMVGIPKPAHPVAPPPPSGPLGRAVQAGAPPPMLALPAPTITVDGEGEAKTTDQRNAEKQARRDILDVTPVDGAPIVDPETGEILNAPQQPEPAPALALPAPAIEVSADGEATTTGQRNTLIQQKRQRIAAGDVLDVTPVPGAEPLTIDNDTGEILNAPTADPVAEIAQEAPPAMPYMASDDAQDSPAAPMKDAPAGYATYATKDEALAYLRQQRRQPRTRAITEVPVQGQDGMWTLRRPEPTDATILNTSGKPFTKKTAAVRAAKKAGPNFEPVAVDGGFAVRKKPDVNISDVADPAGLAAGSGDGASPEPARSVGAVRPVAVEPGRTVQRGGSEAAPSGAPAQPVPDDGPFGALNYRDERQQWSALATELTQAREQGDDAEVQRIEPLLKAASKRVDAARKQKQAEAAMPRGRDGLTEAERRINSIDASADEFVGQIQDESSEPDFDPAELDAAIVNWIRNTGFTQKEFRAAALKKLAKAPKFRRRAGVLRALSKLPPADAAPELAPAPGAAPAAGPAPAAEAQGTATEDAPTRDPELIALRKRASVLRSVIACLKG
jgi:hypothetical protein